jgi:hypothetical protein
MCAIPANCAFLKHTLLSSKCATKEPEWDDTTAPKLYCLMKTPRNKICPRKQEIFITEEMEMLLKLMKKRVSIPIKKDFLPFMTNL